MSHIGIERFWKPKDGEDVTIRFLDVLCVGSFWEHGIPFIDTKTGVARTLQIHEHASVIHKDEVKILACSSEMMKKIADEGRRILQELQTQRFEESRRAAAARFKRSKTMYGAKR